MEKNILRYLLPLLFVLPINGTDFRGNETISETHESKTNRRIVRLYSGTRPKPIVCVGEGFQADPTDCSIFHRCMKNGNGRYISFKFQCGPGTIYDPETEICNHPERTKRTNCGGHAPTPIHIPNIEFAFDNDISKEVPSPISTRDPFSSQKNTAITFSTIRTTHRDDTSTLATKFPWVSTSNQFSESISSSLNPWVTSSKWQDIWTTKTPPTKRQTNELFSNPVTPAWMFPQKLHSTTLRPINRQTTPQTGELCSSEGFMGDSENCRKFYRCINNQRGGFIKYEFMCSDPTIWDDDKQACNHAWAVKRSRCGRGINNKEQIDVGNKKSELNNLSTEQSVTTPHSSQSQIQINYGSQVTQTQTQISNASVKQNQTQINYDIHVPNKGTDNSNIKQNQTQISQGTAISQSQTQINYGDKAVQTQLQIDHSKDSSQSQSQISESTSTIRGTTHYESQSTTSTNSNNLCTKSGFMGDAEDCKKFYRCVDNGRGGFARYDFTCGEGTVWDQTLEACNHAWAVKNCGGKAPIDSSTQSTVKTTARSTTPVASTTLFTTSKTTVTQGYYSSTEEEIDEDNDISYGNQPTSSTPGRPMTTTKPPKPTSTTKAPQTSNNNDCKSSGFMGDNTDCKKFYRCVDNGNGGYTRYEFSCGEGTVWDQKIEACNHVWAVENCGGTVNSGTASSSQPSAAPASSKPPLEIDDYDNGYGPLHEETILSSTSVPITTTKSTTTSQSIQSSTSNIGNKCTSSGFMGDNNDCKKFYRCVDNDNGGYTRYEFSCGEGTVWDPKIQSCNHAWAVEKCGGNSVDDINKVEMTTQKVVTSTTVLSSSSTTQQPDDDNDVGYGQQNNGLETPQSTSSSPQNQNNEGNECKSSGFMGDNNDCKKFYRCVDNGDGTYTRHEFSCGEGTVWDTKIDSCNHVWAVEHCGGISSSSTSKPNQINNNEEENLGGYPSQNDDYVTQSTTSTTIKPLSTTAASVSGTGNNCETSGFMGDSTDCKRFYRCVDNGQGGFTRYEFSCGEGTVWDQSIEACNHAWAVKGQCSESNNLGSTDTQPTTTHGEKDPVSEGNAQPTQKPITSRPTTKPSGNQCSQEGFYGDESNCKNFYRCVDNGQGGFNKYEFTCGDGTVWNQDIQACDHESADKKCSEHTIGSTSMQPSTQNDEMLAESTTKVSTTSTTGNEVDNTSEKPQPSNDKCEGEGFYGDSNNCKKFYRCVDDGKGGFTKYDFTCGDGTVWDQEILACNHESGDKKCTNQLENTPTSTTMTSSESGSSTNSQEQHTTRQPGVISEGSGNDQCEMEGFFANSNDCKKFYRCVSNGNGGFTKHEFSCGEGTVWVQEIQACDYDNDISNCSNKDSSTKPQPTQGQHTTTESTSNNQHTTQSQEPTKENDEYSVASSNRPPGDDDKNNCESEGFFPNKNDCTRFYRCVDNGQGGYTKYDFTCGEGTAWDTNIQTCNHISEVDSCQNSQGEENQSKPNDETSQSSENTSTTKGSSSPSTESSKPSTDRCDQEGYFGNTKDCTKFYRCVDNGKGGLTKYDFTCGEGTIWDQDLTTCNHPQNVVNPSCDGNENSQSSNSSSTTESSGYTSSTTTQHSQSSQGTTESSNQGSSNCSEESTSKKPANQKVKCDKAGFYPDPEDCKKFYRCVDWDGNGEKFSVYHFDCGEGTIWDPQLETCNHEDSVYPPRDCSGGESQNMSQETTTTEKLTTTTESNTDEPTSTQQSSSNESTTSTSTENTTTTTEETTTKQTTQQSTTESTTQQSTTESTTQQSTTEKSTTEQTTTEKSTTEQTTTEKSTTEQTTTSEKTTQQSMTEQTTTESTSTTQEQTTQESTTTTSDKTTTQQSTTSEQTTTQQSTTSEQTTTQQSTTSEQSTQQSSEQTTQQSSTTDDTTTESSTTEQTTSTTEQSSEENSTDQATTESTTEQQTTTTTTETSESTTTESDQGTTSQETSSSDKECPDMDDDQNAFVCPTSFRRHPKYCNMFYQCTEDDDSHEANIATFKCPNNTIYDESKTQCVEEDKADKKCNGQIAQKYRVKRRNSNYKEPIEVGRYKHTCDVVGYYPFEKNDECSGAFLKCQKSKTGKLRGYVHRCPEGYTFWSISKKCEKNETMKGCRQSGNIWKDRWEIPVEKKNIAK